MEEQDTLEGMDAKTLYNQLRSKDVNSAQVGVVIYLLMALIAVVMAAKLEGLF